MIRQQDLGDGIVALVFAGSGSVNTLDRATNEMFVQLVDELLGNADVTGIVLTSDKRDFVVGGDLKELQAATSTTEVKAIVEPFIRALRRLETGGKPVVAAMTGSALGGGLELALACHRRIATDNPGARFGLPEVTLGLMPGAGGTQRLPRLIGLAAAAPLLMQGRRLDVQEAKSRGLIDEIVEPDRLLDAAKAWAQANPTASQPWDRKGYVVPGFPVHSGPGRQFFVGTWANLKRTGPGFNDAGAEAILQVLQQGLERGLDAGIAIETRYFARLVVSNDAKNKIRTLFTGVNQAKSLRVRPDHVPPSQVAHLAVIGAGVMGRGIALNAAIRGIRVTMLDASAENAEKGREEIARYLQREAERGRLRSTPDDILRHIRAGADYQQIADADLVVEAVFERVDVKRAVLQQVAAVVRPDIPVASNTSTIPIARFAEDISQPDRVLGLHFFSPVDRMTLVEVVRAAATSDSTLARALDFLKQLGKTPVVVNDGLGFFTSRVITTYSCEAMNLIGEGVPPQLIDNASVKAGFAIGVASLMDLTTLPLLRDIFASMRGDGQRIANAGSIAEDTVAKLVELGRVGKVAGGGIYDYPPDGRIPWPGLKEHFPPRDSRPVEEATVMQRLLNVQSLEAVRTLDDGIIARPLDGDVACVLGWGYPAHLGGVFAYIDRVGAAQFIAQCEALAERYGERFRPPQRLYDMARKGERFHAA